MKDLSAIEELQAVQTTLEAFGYSIESLTVSEAFQLYGNIKSVINNSLRECGHRVNGEETFL
jgi:hypothetical protein